MSGPYGNVARMAGMGALNTTSGVTASLPAGAVLGEERFEDGLKYRLFYNAGNSQISKGFGFGSVGGTGAYSVTVSTVSDVALGCAGVVYHSTATTGTYFWGVVRGGAIPVRVSNVSVATNALIAPALNGAFTLDPVGTGAVGYNLGDSTTGTGTTDAVSGRFFVEFE
jgi:hypothetical protein